MILSNAHTHTTRCDGNDTPEEMIKAAIKAGFTSLGFSVHSPLPYENDYAIKADKLDAYCDEIERLKDKYRDKINVVSGIELDADSEIDTDRFEYVIGSVHQISGNGKVYSLDSTQTELKDCINELFNGDCLAFSKAYYQKLCDFITQRDVDIIGHFDLITKFDEKANMPDFKSKEYFNIAENAVDIILNSKPNIIFEVNTGAMSRGWRTSPYPDTPILKHLADRNAEIMINSDAHSTKTLQYAFSDAAELCKDCGFTHINRLYNGEFIKTALK